MLYITLGDPLSVNIECLTSILAGCRGSYPIVLLGHYPTWLAQSERFQSTLVVNKVEQVEHLSSGLYFYPVGEDIVQDDATKLTPGERGRLAFLALDQLKKFSLAKCAVLTGPIDKKLTQDAGFQYPGQTEYFASLDNSSSIMILAGPKLRVGLVTNHVAVSGISSLLTQELVSEKLGLFHSTLRSVLGIDDPRIVVTGLNPHCGDGGLFGQEDVEIIRPAVSAARKGGLTKIVGPSPADTAFFHGYTGSFDGVLAMYHDQGLGPLKTVHFYDAVNITGGLKFLRVSPDHGPAVDLYGKGEANSQSFANALEYCKRYLNDES